MKKPLKKIYIEITNLCNLKCSFCSQSSRKGRCMSAEEFENIISQIKDYTDYDEEELGLIVAENIA